METYYRMHCETRRRLGVPPQSRGFFHNVQAFVIAEGHGLVVTAWQSGLPIAAGVFLHFGRQALYKFGASRVEFQEHRPNNLVMWTAIQWYAERGFETLSLGRTDREDVGLLQFKDGWGAVRRPLCYWRLGLGEHAHETRRSSGVPGPSGCPEDGTSASHPAAARNRCYDLSIARVGSPVDPHDVTEITEMQMTPRERETLIEAWNRTAIDYPRDLCLHQLFEAQVERTPDRLALLFGIESLTYRMLDERASRLANHLRQLGAGPDTLIGICLDRSPDLVVAVLGVLKSGSAYVPIDPTYPADRISFMLQDADLGILISQQSLSSALPTSSAHLVMIDKPIESSLGPSEGPACSPTQLAYVRYTSGSTGKPKGVQIEHRSIVNLIESMRKPCFRVCLIRRAAFRHDTLI